VRDPGRTLILGAGPTGLGTAYRFQKLGFHDFTILEASDGPGGLAASVVDEQGFTWDIGGHVQFSHYDEYDAVLDRALGTAWIDHQREAWVFLRDRFVPYPFQHNLHRLDPADARAALADLEQAAQRSDPPPLDFRAWIHRTFGDWIARNFLFPYNEKVWGFPLDELGVGWIGDRVAVPDLARVRRTLREGRDDVEWGPNRRFRYPARGGTGAIWKAVAGFIAPARLRWRAEAVAVDLSGKALALRSGETLTYDTLVSTLPLDRLARLCHGLDESARQAAGSLRHSSVHILGVGLEGDKPSSLESKCWIYFPEPDAPYYRVTVFSNYSPFNVPQGRDAWSLMAEVCETPARPVNIERLRERTLEAMRRDGLLGAHSSLLSFWHRREEYGYPTPSQGRDAALDLLLPALEKHEVYSRGRFGAWKYEVSNQDHSFMQGVELADRLLGRGEEPTLNQPHRVNSGAFARV